MSTIIQQSQTSIFNASPTPRTEGGGGPQQADSLGNSLMSLGTALAGEDSTNDLIGIMPKPVVSTTYSWTRFQNLGANLTLNVKASAGNVFSFYCHNITGSPRYFQIHNTATVPALSAVPTLAFLIPLSSSIIVGPEFFGSDGNNFATGIAFAFSATEATYTTGSLVATDHITQLQYT